MPVSLLKGITETRRSAGRGFTLIELLVVISIISLLIAVLLPALKKARESAMQIKCATQVRQHGQAVIAYAGDNKEKGPQMNQHFYNGVWPGQIAPYLGYTGGKQFRFMPGPGDTTTADVADKHIAILRCPVRQKPWSGGNSYGLNGYVTTTVTFANKIPFKPTLTAKPSSTYLGGDAGSYNMLYTSWLDNTIDPANTVNYSGTHLGGLNILYCDGHVKFQRERVWASIFPPLIFEPVKETTP